MKTKLISLILTAFLFATNSSQAASKVLPRLKLQKGTTYDMTTVSTNHIEQEMMGQKMVIDQKNEMTFSYKVIDVLPESNFLIEASFQKMKMDMKMNGQDISIDSEGDQTNPMNSVLKALSALKLNMKVSSAGKVLSVEGIEDYSKVLSSNPQLAQGMPMFSNNENFNIFFAQTFNYFPEMEIGVGDQWKKTLKLPELMNTEIELAFSVTGTDNGQLSLNVIADVDKQTQIEQMGMKMDAKIVGKQSGVMTVDTKDGWLTTSETNEKFDMKLKMNNPQTGAEIEIPVSTSSKSVMTCVKK